MSNTSMTRLREHLFDVIERLKEGNDPKADPKDTIDIERAKAISLAADKIIGSAKVEVEAIKIISKGDDYSAAELIRRSATFQLQDDNSKNKIKDA